MKRRTDFTATIASQVDDFMPTFNARIGPELARVFEREQQDLRRAGVPTGTAVAGDKLPDAVLCGVDGSFERLSTLLDGAAAVIVFYRGSWCPFCDIALRTYQRELRPVVDALGTKLLAVSPQAPHRAAASARTAGLTLDLYCDEGNALARSLGIVTTPSDEAMRARAALGIDVVGAGMDRTATIPFPTVLVCDATGTIRLIDVRADYTTRTETRDIVDALIAL